jgi:ketosteroid isomerase-like protein
VFPARLTPWQPALAVLLAGACQPVPRDGDHSAAKAAPLAAADLAAIRAADSAFATAANAGNAAGVAGTYLPDAHLMPPNLATIEGRDAIQKFWGGLLDANRVKIGLTSDEVEGRGDLAYSRGRYTFEITPKEKGKGEAGHDEGKFLEILRREPDGSWHYAVDMYSSDLPPSGAAKSGAAKSGARK